MNSKEQWREWARTLDEREVQRITRQLAAAVARARTMRPEAVSGEPARLNLPPKAERIARGIW